MTASAPQTNPVSRLHNPARTYRSQRFADALTNANAQLTAIADRYPFDVGLSHSHLYDGSSRRTQRTPAAQGTRSTNARPEQAGFDARRARAHGDSTTRSARRTHPRIRSHRRVRSSKCTPRAAEEGSRVGKDRTGADPRPAARVPADGESPRRPLGATEDRLRQSRPNPRRLRHRTLEDARRPDRAPAHRTAEPLPLRRPRQVIRRGRQVIK